MVCYTCGACRLADLGLIGNCQLAAHVRRDGAIVWCCMPRFDSEPIFGALLDDDGGQFTIGPGDAGPGRAALPGQHQRPRDALRGAGGRVPGARLRAALRPVRPQLPADQARPYRGAAGRHAADPGVLRPGARLVEGAAAARIGLAPHQLSRLPVRGAAHHRRPAVLPRWRAVRAHRAQALRASPGARRSRKRWSRCASASSARPSRYWQMLGEALRRAVDLPGGSDPLGAGAEAPLLRGHRRDRRGADHVDPGVGRARGARGTTATAGCATPTTRSARSACSATSRSASSSSTSC